MRNSHDMVNAEMPDFVARCQALVDQKVAESLQKYQNLTREQIDLRKLDWKVGRGAYYRVGFVKPDGEMFQLYCFVDKATGEVLGGSWGAQARPRPSGAPSSARPQIRWGLQATGSSFSVKG